MFVAHFEEKMRYSKCFMSVRPSKCCPPEGLVVKRRMIEKVEGEVVGTIEEWSVRMSL